MDRGKQKAIDGQINSVMKQFDPYAPATPPKPQETLLFSGSQLTGPKASQEDSLAHFGDECFIVADGVGSLPHGQYAAQLSTETALWAYKVVRAKPFYWSEKPELLKRIFRSTNLTLWQKRREKGFEQGLASALIVLLIGPDNFWVGSAGNCTAFLYREGLIDILNNHDIDDEGFLTKAVGFGRSQLIPERRSEKFIRDDTILLATDGVTNFVSEDQMRVLFEQTDATQKSIDDAVIKLLQTAQANGSDDNMTAYMIKRVMPET